ncbi:MmgE/PrpD family protein [Sphingomonas sp. YL-JM2C]
MSSAASSLLDHSRQGGTSHRERTTASLAGFVAETPFEAIPGPIVHATKRLILDEIIVAAAAIRTPMAQALLRLKHEQGGAPDSTIVVGGERLPVQSAAYVHAQIANLLDADETMLNRMHTVSASAMAGLALAEKLGASGRDLIAAVALGYDITARVGMSLCQYVEDGKGGLIFAPLFGWSWMAFGAAATCARLLGLDAVRTARALGQALVTAPVSYDIVKSNLPEFTDGMPAYWHKYQMCGAAAEAGVNAALLASHGWVAQTDILDEGSLFWRSFGAAGCDFDVMYRDLGSHWYVGDCAIKPYPFCRYGHAAIDIFSRIVRTENLGPDDIEDVLIRVPPIGLCITLAELTVVDEPLKLLHSLPTALALVALGITPGPRWYEIDLASEQVRGIARRMRSEVAQEWGPIILEQQDSDGSFRRLPAEIVVRTRTGQEHRGFAEYAKGDPWAEGYEMTDEDLAGKARSFLADILPAARIEALVTAGFALDRAETLDDLTQAMRA